MARKVVFVIVEGPSDKEALELFFIKFYNMKMVRLEVLYRDITTDQGVNSRNIHNKIYEEVKRYMNRNPIKKSDFQEIIHIVDTDGAYVENTQVIEDMNKGKTFYTETEILTSNKKGIEKRNEQKKDNLNKLSVLNKVGGIPYHVYYMSCNLDHVLHNKLNSTDEEKEKDAHNFAKKYKDDLPAFIKFISESDFAVSDSYPESWKYIKVANHSLERHTNLGLCFYQGEA